MSNTADWPELAEALAEMARDLLAQDSVRDTLTRVCEHAVTLLPGCEAAGIMAVRRGRVETLAATDNVVRASDRLQGELGEGPCFDASRNRHQVYRIGDVTETASGWPRYAPEAARLGIGSMMGFLLYTRERPDLGALDLYSSRPGAFTRSCEQVGWLLAAHAAVAMAGAQHVDHLNRALDSRQVIGEAIGILMARYALSEGEAFDRMAKVSQDRNVKLRQLAEDVTRTGELP